MGGDLQTRELGIFPRQQHLLDAAGNGQIEIELLPLNLQMEKLGVVQGERRLLGQRLQQREVSFREALLAAGIRDGQDPRKIAPGRPVARQWPNERSGRDRHV